jgi:hypothetical protein
MGPCFAVRVLSKLGNEPHEINVSHFAGVKIAPFLLCAQQEKRMGIISLD